MNEPAHRPILIVEDSPEDFTTLRRAFKKAEASNPIFHCEDGDEALEFLRDPNQPYPGVILLDLNLPGTDGREILAEIKADDELRCIPVVILTSSVDQRDVQACYRAGANSYVQKPVDLKGFLKTIEQLHSFWFGASVLP